MPELPLSPGAVQVKLMVPGVLPMEPGQVW